MSTKVTVKEPRIDKATEMMVDCPKLTTHMVMNEVTSLEMQFDVTFSKSTSHHHHSVIMCHFLDISETS